MRLSFFVVYPQQNMFEYFFSRLTQSVCVAYTHGGEGPGPGAAIITSNIPPEPALKRRRKRRRHQAQMQLYYVQFKKKYFRSMVLRPHPHEPIFPRQIHPCHIFVKSK